MSITGTARNSSPGPIGAARGHSAAAVGAIVAVVVDFAGVVSGGRFVAVDAPVSDVRDYYIGLGSRAGFHALCICVALTLLLWFAGHVRAVLQTAGSGREDLARLFYGATVVVVAIELSRAATLAAVGLRARDLGADVVTAAHVFYQMVGPIEAVPVAAALLSIAAAARRSADLPRWLAPAAMGAGGLWLVSTVRLFTGGSLVWATSIPAFASYAAVVAGLAVAALRGNLPRPRPEGHRGEVLSAG